MFGQILSLNSDNSANSANTNHSNFRQRSLLFKSALLALSLELSLLFLISWGNRDFFSDPPQTLIDESRFIEAQVFERPENKKILAKPSQSEPIQKEATLSKIPGQGKKSVAQETPAEEKNQTTPGTSTDADHGPIAFYSPPPVIPPYLQNQEFKTSVVILFFVSAQGKVQFKLIRSSGNEELDAIALEAVEKWKFNPGEKDGKPIDSKVSLKIVFQVTS